MLSLIKEYEICRLEDIMAYNIIFYERENGKSEIWDLLEKLRKKSNTDKNARIQYKQITLYIELLQNNGTFLPDNITKHIEENIWELRPGNNRIFYFFHDDKNFVLLHSFRKKTQKTPHREIEKAKSEREDYLKRRGL